MSLKVAADTIKKFASLVESRDILKRQNEIEKHIAGPISNAREKLKTLESVEAAEVLAEAKVSLDFGQRIKNNILNIFDEEVSHATKLLKEIESTIHNLQDLLDTALNNIANERFQPTNQSSRLILDCYEHCRSILIFLKIKNKILKHYLLAPPEMPLNADPFSQVPNFLAEEENVVYLLCKIEYANFSQY